MLQEMQPAFDCFGDILVQHRFRRIVTDPARRSQKDHARRNSLGQNHGIVASFSRALLEGLTVRQTDAEFDAMLDASIRRIYEASII